MQREAGTSFHDVRGRRRASNQSMWCLPGPAPHSRGQAYLCGRRGRCAGSCLGPPAWVWPGRPEWRAGMNGTSSQLPSHPCLGSFGQFARRIGGILSPSQSLSLITKEGRKKQKEQLGKKAIP